MRFGIYPLIAAMLLLHAPHVAMAEDPGYLADNEEEAPANWDWDLFNAIQDRAATIRPEPKSFGTCEPCHARCYQR